MPLRTTVAKATQQIERRDANGADRYRAELRYFHVPQRAILGMTNAYAVLDETYTWPDVPPVCACGSTWPGHAYAPGHTATRCTHPHALPPT